MPGYFAASTGASLCAACASGTVSATGAVSCTPCDAGTFSNLERTACVRCPAGTWSAALKATSNATCTPCAVGTFSSVSGLDAAEKCNACPPGKHGTLRGATRADGCAECEAGSFAEGSGQTACAACTSGFSTQGSAYCSDCPAGTESNSATRACEPCGVGSMSNTGSRCAPCGAGTYANAERTACAPCPAGTWSSVTRATSDTTCVPCAAGAFSSAAGLDAPSKCTKCPPGKRSRNTGRADSADYCVDCAESRFSVSSGQTACAQCSTGFSMPGASFCTDCPAGKRLANNTCVPCAAGRFAASGGQTTCAACTTGVSTSGASFCEECPAGKRLLSNTCVPCAAGRFNALKGQTTCAPCGTAGFSNPGATFCIDCEAGEKLVVENNTCVPCSAGRFSALRGRTVCAPCGTKGVSDRGATFCRECAAGEALVVENNKCAPCAAGRFSAFKGQTSCVPCGIKGVSDHGATFCRECAAGEALVVEKNKCAPCAAGRFSAFKGQTACIPCGAKGVSNQSATFCQECAAGKTLAAKNNTCVPCAAGSTSLRGGKCRKCEPGRYAEAPGADSCVVCPDFMTSRTADAWRCVADKGYVYGRVLRDRYESVHKCPELGANCTVESGVVGARVEGLVLEPGFWRPTYASLNVSKCPVGAGCVGGVSIGPEGAGVCSNATTGPYCAVCAEGYTRQGAECVDCDNLGTGIAWAPIFALLGVVACASLLAYAVRKRAKEKWESVKQRAQGIALAAAVERPHNEHGRVVEKIKIAYAFVQVVSSGVEEFDLPFPEVFSEAIALFSIANLDLFGFLSVGCVVDVTFYGELASTCIAPVALAAAALGYAKRRYAQDPAQRWQQTFTRFSLVMLFCVYSGVTRKIFSTYKCEPLPTAGLDAGECAARGYTWYADVCYRSFLRADLRLSCDVPEHAAWGVFAGLMALVYPVGVPLLFALLLRRSHGEDESLAFIRAAYENKFYWWEIVELGRKLLLTLVLVFFYEGSASQILVTILVAFGFFAVLRTYKPYKSDDDDILAAFAQALLMLTSLAALCLKVDVQAEDGWSEGAFDAVLTALVVSVPIFALFEVLLAAGVLRRLPRWCRRREANTPPQSVAPESVADSRVVHEDEGLTTSKTRFEPVQRPSRHFHALVGAVASGHRRESALKEAHDLVENLHRQQRRELDEARRDARVRLEQRRIERSAKIRSQRQLEAQQSASVESRQVGAAADDPPDADGYSPTTALRPAEATSVE